MTGPARPTRVHVGPYTYRVKWLREEDWPIGESQQGGLSWHANREIWIRLIGNEAHEDTLREILLHEILHCVADVTGLNLLDVPKKARRRDEEETVIQHLSPTLFGALRANPRVLAYLTGKSN